MALRRVTVVAVVAMLITSSAFAFSISDLFRPIARALGILPQSNGIAPTIDSFKVVKSPDSPGSPFTVKLCVVTAPFAEMPVRAEFAIDSTSNIVRTSSFVPDSTKSITCQEYSLQAPWKAGTHTVYARVSDAEGDWSNWESDTFVVPGTNPPKIESIDAPNTVEPNESFTVRVRATDPDGDLRLISIEVGDYKKSVEVDGGDETATFTVPRLPEGTYTLTAEAMDSKHNTDAETKTITVRKPYTGPSISVSASPENVYVGEKVTITASASGENLRRIAISVNNELVKTQDCFGGDVCKATAEYAPQSAGDYRVVATIYDGYGKSASDSATFSAEKRPESCRCEPHVSLDVSPTKVNTEESVEIRAEGEVSYSGNCEYKPLATRIRVYVDGKMVKNFDCGAPYDSECTKGPFTFRYTFDSAGKHEVQAQMVWDDCRGATRDDAWSETKYVNVEGTTTPTVTISASKTEVSPGESVTFTAEGKADQIDSIAIVVDGVTKKTQKCYLSSSCSASYTTSFQSGTHDAYAVLRYVENGNIYSKTSKSIMVRVVSSPPPSAEISIKALPGTEVRVNDPVTLVATAKSSAGIDHIVFYIDGRGVDVEHCDGSTSCSVSYRTSFATAGTHTAYARAYYDNARYHKDSDRLTITVKERENTPPVVYRLDGYAVTYADVPYTVTVCAKDKDGTVTRIEAWLDNRTRKSVSVDSVDVCKKITLYAPLMVGKHSVHARAMDNDGAWSATVTKTFTVIRRNVPPVAKVYAPRRVSPGKEFSFRVCGKDSDGRVVKVAAKVGSSSWTEKNPDSEGCATFSAVAPDKETTITVYGKAKDDAGAWSRVASAEVDVRDAAPAIIRYDVPATVYVGREFKVSVSARDADGDLAGADLVIKERKSVVARAHRTLHGSSDSAQFTTSVPAPGEYNAVITVSDRHGKKTTKWKMFEAVLPPNKPPVVDSVAVPGTVYAGEPFDVNVCAHDPDGVVEWVRAAVRPGGALVLQRFGRNGCATVHFASPGKDITTGKYTLEVVAIDARGAESKPYRVPITVKERDMTPPVIHVLDVQDTNVPGKIFVRVDVTDNVGLSDANVYYRFPGAADWTLAGSYDLTGQRYAFVASVPASVPGDYNIMVAARDTSGNIGRAYAVGHAVDQIPPTISIKAPDEVNQGKEFKFTVSVRDNYRIKGVSVSVDGETIFSSGSIDANYWEKTFTHVFPHAGEHRIVVVATDHYDNDADEVHPIAVHPVDENAPVIDLNATYDENSHNVEWNVQVSDPNLKDVNVYFNGDYVGSCDVENGKASCSGAHIVDSAGEYVVKVTAEDNYGNLAEKSKTINVGDEPPVLDVSAPAEVAVGKEFTIHVVASDDFGLSRIEIFGEGVEFNEAVNGRTFSVELNAIISKEGNYAYVAWAYDGAGHVTEKNITVTATRAGHSYDVILSSFSGETGRVLIQGKIDGSIAGLRCSDVVVNIEPADSKTPLGTYTVHDTTADGHSACEVVVTGTGKYIVRATWMGVTKGTVVTVFAHAAAAPENVAVALVLGIIALAVMGRLI